MVENARYALVYSKASSSPTLTTNVLTTINIVRHLEHTNAGSRFAIGVSLVVNIIPKLTSYPVARFRENAHRIRRLRAEPGITGKPYAPLLGGAVVPVCTL